MGEGTVPDGAYGEAPEGAPPAGLPPASTTGWAAPGGSPATPPPEPVGVGGGVPSGVGGGPGYGPAGTAYPRSSTGQSGQAWQPAWGTALHAHKPGIVALRPLSLGDIIEGGFACLRRSPRTFLGFALVTSLAVLLVGGGLFLVGYLVSLSLDGADTLDRFLAFGLTSALAVLLFLSSASSIALSGILAYPVGEAVLGRNPSMSETWRRTRRHVPRLVGLCAILVVPPTVVFGLVILLTVWGFSQGAPALGAVGVVVVVGLLVAALWLGIRLSLATPALVLEDLGVIASLRRSWRLTPRLFWRTFGILLTSSVLIGIVQYALSFIVQIGGLLLGLAVGSLLSGDSSEVFVGGVVVVVTVAGGLLSGIITQPFLAAVLALLYTDARIRKEGFDLALARAVADAGRSPR